jgi:hypothetical protein
MNDHATDEKKPVDARQGHPALLLTVGYLLISLLGLSFVWTLFGQFGGNFFYFAEVTYSRMGALYEPIAFLLSATALLVGGLTHVRVKTERAWLARKDRGDWILETHRRFANARFNPFSPASFFVGDSVMFIWIHAESRADELRAGEAAQVTVRMADGPEPRRLQLPGASSRFVFFYTARSDETVMVPPESIAAISAHAGGS